MSRGKYAQKKERKEKRKKEELLIKVKAANKKEKENTVEKMSLFEEVLTDNTYLVWITLLASLLVNGAMLPVSYFFGFFVDKKSDITSFHFCLVAVVGMLIYGIKVKKTDSFNIKKFSIFYVKLSLVSWILGVGIYLSFNADLIYVQNAISNWAFISYIIINTIIVNKIKNKSFVFLMPVILLIVCFLEHKELIFVNLSYVCIVISSLVYVIYCEYKGQKASEGIINKLKISNSKLPEDNNWYKSSRVLSMLGITTAFLNSYYFILVLCIYGPKYFSNISAQMVPMNKRNGNRAFLDLLLNVLIIVFVYVMANKINDKYNLFNLFYVHF